MKKLLAFIVVIAPICFFAGYWIVENGWQMVLAMAFYILCSVIYLIVWMFCAAYLVK